MKAGDTVYFSSPARLVNEGTVEEILGPYIRVKTKCPGVEYLMKQQAFPTKEELRKSKAYNSAWHAGQRMQDMVMAHMASMWPA